MSRLIATVTNSEKTKAQKATKRNGSCEGNVHGASRGIEPHTRQNCQLLSRGECDDGKQGLRPLPVQQISEGGLERRKPEREPLCHWPVGCDVLSAKHQLGHLPKHES